MYYKNKDELEAAIQLLELKHANELKLVQQQIKLTAERIKPLNLLKSTLLDIKESQVSIGSIFGTALILATEFVVGKINTGKPTNKLLNLVISAIEFTIFKYSSKI